MEEKRLSLLELKSNQLKARKQQDPELEKTINETIAKIAAYSKRVEANRPKPNPAEQAKEAGLLRVGIRKQVDDREVIARV